MANIKFLKVYEVGNQWYVEDGMTDFDNIFIQEDTWDFHLFRILSLQDGGVMVEHEKIDKLEIAEMLKLSIYKDVRGVFQEMDAEKVCKAVVDYDIDNGFECWDTHEFSNMKDAIDSIVETFQIFKIA